MPRVASDRPTVARAVSRLTMHGCTHFAAVHRATKTQRLIVRVDPTDCKYWPTVVSSFYPEFRVREISQRARTGRRVGSTGSGYLQCGPGTQ